MSSREGRRRQWGSNVEKVVENGATGAVAAMEAFEIGSNTDTIDTCSTFLCLLVNAHLDNLNSCPTGATAVDIPQT